MQHNLIRHWHFSILSSTLYLQFTDKLIKSSKMLLNHPSSKMENYRKSKSSPNQRVLKIVSVWLSSMKKPMRELRKSDAPMPWNPSRKSNNWPKNTTVKRRNKKMMTLSCPVKMNNRMRREKLDDESLWRTRKKVGKRRQHRKDRKIQCLRRNWRINAVRKRLWRGIKLRETRVRWKKRGLMGRILERRSKTSLFETRRHDALEALPT